MTPPAQRRSRSCSRTHIMISPNPLLSHWGLRHSHEAIAAAISANYALGLLRGSHGRALCQPTENNDVSRSKPVPRIRIMRRGSPSSSSSSSSFPDTAQSSQSVTSAYCVTLTHSQVPQNLILLITQHFTRREAVSTTPKFRCSSRRFQMLKSTLLEMNDSSSTCLFSPGGFSVFYSDYSQHRSTTTERSSEVERMNPGPTLIGQHRRHI